MIKRGLTIFALAMACTGLGGAAAFAQDGGDGAGFYARAYGGISTLNNTTVSVGASSASARFDGGLLVGGAFGYDYEGPWKAEIEYTYRSSDARRLPASFARGGDYASTSIMVNGLYSFGEVGPLRPYVGAGAGFSPELDLDLTSSGPSAPPPSALGNYSRSGRFAYQGIAGAELPLTDRWTGFGEFRVFAIDSPSLRSSSKTLKADYQTIDLLVGVSRRF